MIVSAGDSRRSSILFVRHTSNMMRALFSATFCPLSAVVTAARTWQGTPRLISPAHVYPPPWPSRSLEIGPSIERDRLQQSERCRINITRGQFGFRRKLACSEVVAVIGQDVLRRAARRLHLRRHRRNREQETQGEDTHSGVTALRKAGHYDELGPAR